MRKSAIAACVLMAGSFVSSLHAQPTEVHFTAPFHFTVSGRTLPAGAYRCYTQPDGILILQKMDRTTGALSPITLSDTPGPHHGIVFHKYGDRYFLREIDSAVGQVNGELPISKPERQIQRLEASTPVEEVTVALGN
ncbi:hypothetical protein [Silvibacterium sp.]|uniref:hypothetical protein n=1 Tax=Silvibacterium sp. TaxID=1964179 RepID=UPI0039E34DED